MRAKQKCKTEKGLLKTTNPQFEKLVKDIVRIIENTSKEIDRIRKNFPDMLNPLKKTARRKEKK